MRQHWLIVTLGYHLISGNSVFSPQLTSLEKQVERAPSYFPTSERFRGHIAQICLHHSLLPYICHCMLTLPATLVNSL